MAGEGLRSQSELTQRVISAVIMAAAAIALAWYGSWPFALVWAGLAAAVGYEWGRIVAPGQATALAAAVAAAGAGMVLAVFVPAALPYVLAALALLVVAQVTLSRHEHRGWLATGIVYASLLAICTILLRGDEDRWGRVAIFYLFAVVWMTDIGAYFAGRTFGGPKFAPKISPKKTWSGVVGGLLSGLVCGLLVLALGRVAVGLPHVLLTLLLGCSVVFGDLFESFLKRRFGVKDAGALIPGHGGFLDRLDGFALAVILATLVGVARAGHGRVAMGLVQW